MLNIKKRNQKGFTLIELMIVIAIIGILAVVALPTYRTFTVRAKASELITATANGQQIIQEYIVVNGTRPPTTFTIPNNTSAMVSSVAFNTTTRGVRVVGVSNSTGLGAVVIMNMNPTMSGSNVSWACVPELGTQYMPASCN